MPYEVEIKTGAKQVSLPNGGLYNAGDTVTLTDEQYFKISAGALTAYIDGGEGTWVPGDDQVYTAGEAVDAPEALTAASLDPGEDDLAVIVGGVNDIIADVTALRGVVEDLVESLSGEGKALAAE